MRLFAQQLPVVQYAEGCLCNTVASGAADDTVMLYD